MSDLRDSIEQAISDSLDADWKPSWAADAIMELPIVAAAPALLEALKDCLVVIDDEIDQRKNGGNDEDWLALQALSDRAHAVAAQVAA